MGALFRSCPETATTADMDCRNTVQQPKEQQLHSRPDRCRRRPGPQEIHLGFSVKASQPGQLRRLLQGKATSTGAHQSSMQNLAC